MIGKTRLTFIAIGAIALAGGIYWSQSPKPAPGAPSTAQSPAQAQRSAVAARPPVPVNVDTVQRGPMPVRVDAVGMAQPVASVALKTRVDAQIETIHVADGASVKAGDKLVKLDSRQIEAQIKQTEANIAKDNAAVEQSERDVLRLTDLLGRGSGTQLNVDNAKTQLAAARAVLAADQANLRNGRSIIRMTERQPEIRLLRDFDPTAAGRDLDDPWGYPPAEYERTAAEISAAIPGLLAELRDRL